MKYKDSREYVQTMLCLVNRLAVNEKETCMDTLKDLPEVTWNLLEDLAVGQ